MNKTDVISALAERNKITKTLAKDILESLNDIICDSISEGNDVVIRDFIKVSTKHRAARTGKNPRTGESIRIPERTVVVAKLYGRLGKSDSEAV